MGKVLSIPAGHLPASKSLQNRGVDKYPIRRLRVRELIEGRFNGSQTEFADEAGVPDTTVSRWFSQKEGKKNIGEKLARRVEENLKLEPYSLDREDNAQFMVSEASAVYWGEATAEEARVGHEWGKLDEPLRSHVRVMIESLVAEQIRARRGATRPAKRQVGARHSERQQ